MGARKRRRRRLGRPRVHHAKAERVNTTLAPKLLVAVRKIAAVEKRSVSFMIGMLIEEALVGRGLL